MEALQKREQPRENVHTDARAHADCGGKYIERTPKKPVKREEIVMLKAGEVATVPLTLAGPTVGCIVWLRLLNFDLHSSTTRALKARFCALWCVG